jgi:HK97 gp10 family phage protein
LSPFQSLVCAVLRFYILSHGLILCLFLKVGDIIANLNARLPEDFLLKISRLNEKTDEIVPRVLAAGADAVLPKLKTNLEAAIGSSTQHASRSTGELSAALGVSPAKLDKNGNYDVKIGFSEPRSDGDSNAKIANILEYGSSNQPARPFLAPVKSATRGPCRDAMIQKLESELNNV